MNDLENNLGLPSEADVFKELDKESQKITIRTALARFRKKVTIINGIEDKEKAKELGKLLRKKLACGGTVKDGMIELQGEHTKRAKQILIQQGYKEELIDSV